MNREEIQKLLGGYATGTLTPEEQQALFAAALEDQELFDSLAREDTLREVLNDPGARAHLLAALDEAREPWYVRWWRPALVLATAVLLVVGLGVWQSGPRRPPRKMAKLAALRPAGGGSAPVLPPPPEVKQAALDLHPYALPAPAAAPLPPGQNPPLLRGMVTDSSGAAVPSATVQVKSAAGTVRTTATNGRGEFTVPEARGTDYQITASAPGFDPATMTAPPPNRPLVVRLRAGTTAATLQGRVTDPTGAGVSSATVQVTTATGQKTIATTDEKGEFRVPAAESGSYQIVASAAGYPPAMATTDASAPPVNLRLERGLVSAGYLAAPMAGAAGVPRMQAPAAALELHLLRRTGEGSLVEVSDRGTVAPDAVLILRVTPHTDGSLLIEQANGTTVTETPVKSGVTSDVELPRFPTPGPVDLRVYIRPPQSEVKAPPAAIRFNVR